MGVWKFDTSADVSTDTIIQNGVLALLEPLRWDESKGTTGTPRGPYVRTLQGLPALPDVPDAENLNERAPEWLSTLPAILVYVGAGKRDGGSPGGSLMMRRTIGIFCVSGVATDLRDGRLDESEKVTADPLSDPGVRVIRQHVVEHIHQSQVPFNGAPLSGADAIRVEEYDEWHTTPTWTSWWIRATIRVDELICSQSTRDALPVDDIRASHDLYDKGVIAQQKTELTPP